MPVSVTTVCVQAQRVFLVRPAWPVRQRTASCCHTVWLISCLLSLSGVAGRHWVCRSSMNQPSGIGPPVRSLGSLARFRLAGGWCLIRMVRSAVVRWFAKPAGLRTAATSGAGALNRHRRGAGWAPVTASVCLLGIRLGTGCCRPSIAGGVLRNGWAAGATGKRCQAAIACPAAGVRSRQPLVCLLLVMLMVHGRRPNWSSRPAR